MKSANVCIHLLLFVTKSSYQNSDLAGTFVPKGIKIRFNVNEMQSKEHLLCFMQQIALLYHVVSHTCSEERWMAFIRRLYSQAQDDYQWHSPLVIPKTCALFSIKGLEIVVNTQVVVIPKERLFMHICVVSDPRYDMFSLFHHLP